MIYLTIFFDVVVTDVFDAVARPDLISILARPKTGYSLSTELEKKSKIAEELLLYFLLVNQSIGSTFEYVQKMQQLGSGRRKGLLDSVR